MSIVTDHPYAPGRFEPGLQVGDSCGPDLRGVVWADGRCLPKGIMDVHPAALAVFQVIGVAFALIVVVFMIRDCLRKRSVTWHFMVATVSACCFWQETFGDWGQHLTYSPELAHYTLPLWYTAPHNPLAMPIIYCVYWWAHAIAILRMAQWLQRRNPGLTLGKAIISLSLPVTWIWNVIFEGFATATGLWTYDPPIGPAIHWLEIFGRDTYWPLTWPVLLMLGWINLIAWMIGPPEEQRRVNKLEAFMGLRALLQRPGWSRRPQDESGLDPMLGSWGFQTVRYLSWIVFFNVTFFLCLVLPLFLMRMVPGLHSYYLPIPWDPGHLQ